MENRKYAFENDISRRTDSMSLAFSQQVGLLLLNLFERLLCIKTLQSNIQVLF